MSLRAFFASALALLMSTFVAGCRTISHESSLETQLAGLRLPIDDARAGRVLSRYLEMSDARSALRGSARVFLEGPDFRLNRPQRILVERPARLRFEIICLFDQIAAMLAVDGPNFDFYDASNGQISRGRVTSSLLWDLTKIDLAVGEVVELLLGAPRPSPGIARASVWLEPNGRMAMVFAWPRREPAAACAASPRSALLESACFAAIDALDEGGELFYFDKVGRLVEMRRLGSNGVIRFRATFEDYRPLIGDPSTVEFPNRTTIRSPRAGSLARFEWKQVVLAEELSDRFFEIRPSTTSSRGS